jgi:Uma2 family endonuclease
MTTAPSKPASRPAARSRLLTAEEFFALEDDPRGRQMELEDGRVVMVPPAGGRHGRVSRAAFRRMDAFVLLHDLGEMYFETGFVLRKAPDVVRAPDVAFVAKRPGPEAAPEGYFDGAPSLAVEVVSPSDRDVRVSRKVAEYLDAGSARVWVIRPEIRTVTVHRPGGDAHTYGAGDRLTSSDAGFAAEGFELPLDDLFA